MQYEDTDEVLVDLFDEVMEDFVELNGALFKLIYYTKKKKSQGNYVVAQIKSMNEILRYWSSLETNTEEGYDYCIFIDRKVFDVLDEDDKKRVLRNQLYHCEVEHTKKGETKYKLRGPTVRTFYEEIDAESGPDGDPSWAERVSEIAISIHEDDEEDD